MKFKHLSHYIVRLFTKMKFYLISLLLLLIFRNVNADNLIKNERVFSDSLSVELLSKINLNSFLNKRIIDFIENDTIRNYERISFWMSSPEYLSVLYVYYKNDLYIFHCCPSKIV